MCTRSWPCGTGWPSGPALPSSPAELGAAGPRVQRRTPQHVAVSPCSRLVSLKVLNSIVLLGKSCQYVKEAKMEEKLFHPPPASAPGKPPSKSQNKCKASQGRCGSLFITSVNCHLENQLSECSMIKQSLLSSAFKTRFCFARLWIIRVHAEVSSQTPLGKSSEPFSVCPCSVDGHQAPGTWRVQGQLGHRQDGRGESGWTCTVSWGRAKQAGGRTRGVGAPQL